MAMLPTTFSRLAATGFVSTQSTAAATTALTTQCLARRSTNHQRRQSSSKAAPPADNNKPAPAAKSTAPAAEATSQAPAVESRIRGKKTSRHSRVVSSPSERSKAKTNYYAGLPAVPGVQHLHEKDFGLCSFFSLHRPLSLTAAVPPPASKEQFNSIFESKETRDSWENGNSAERRPEDVIYTLHNTIDALENGTADVQEDGVRWEVTVESQANSGVPVKHLDGAPRIKSLKELVDQFRPFNAPPPPESFVQDQPIVPKRKASRAEKSAQAPRQKRYSATIMVTESTDAQGQRTYTASASPIVPVPDVEDPYRPASMKEPGSRRVVRQPFLERMYKRGRMHAQAQHDRALDPSFSRAIIRRAPSARRIKMLLISVKRQRKLKMKKHKYKKLMKRTRTLRRRLERA